MRTSLYCAVSAILMAGTANAVVDLSPAKWPAADRTKVEAQEHKAPTPLEKQLIESERGIVSATVSPIAVYAGLQALRHGGNAADAAATTALTQVTTQLGSVVSYAGIFTMVYYDAKTHKVYSMDAGYNSYLHENDPSTIPVGDLGPLSVGLKPTEGGAKGRETLVPGFMAGLEAMQRRFGKLPFKSVFAPAIYYNEQGLRISATLQRYFEMRGKFLARTPEGRAFMAQSGGQQPKEGEIFKQPGLAKTLRAISEQGSKYMYTGEWSKKFVRLVQREGGKVTAKDLSRYKPIWSEPYHEEFLGHTIYVNGPPHYGAYDLLTGLNLIEATGLAQKGPYWSDVDTLQDLMHISDLVSGAPVLNAQMADFLKAKSIDVSPPHLLTKDFAAKVAPLLADLYTPPADNGPHHSNAIVVVDKDGNIAAVTHTINAVIWGDTGIVVGGIPIPDSAAFQQARLSNLKAGERLPHEIIDVIAFTGKTPVLATASIGSSLVPESLRVLLGYLGQRQDLPTLMAAPAVMANLDFGQLNQVPGERPVGLVAGAYSAEFVATLKERKLPVTEVPTATAAGLRGTLAAVAIDASGRKSAINQPGVLVFNGAE